MRTLEHLTINGAIRIGRRVYWSKGRGLDDRLERWLGIADDRVSVGARELCCRATLGGLGFEKAAEVLWRLGQIRVGKERLREITQTEGRRVLEASRTGAVRPEWTAASCPVRPGGPTRLVLGCDGVMVPVITAEEKRKRRANRRRRKARRRRGPRHRGADQRFKEFKVAAFADASKEHRHVVGTAGNHEVLGRLMRREAGRLGVDEADERVAVVDGAEWIRRQLETRLPRVQVRILDYFHLMEHVGAAAIACFGEGSEAASTWCTALSAAVCEEGAAALLVRIHQTLSATRAKTKREALKALEQYVTKRTDMLDYPAYRAQGFDIGSGMTEAACKTLTLRLKGSGMRWDQPNAEAMMALAALDQSNLWTPYWNLQRSRAA